MRITMFSFFPSRRSARLAGLALAASLLSLPLAAQDALTPQAGAPGPNPPATATEGTPTQTPTVTLSNDKKSRKTDKDDRVKQTKDTRKENKKETHEKTLVGKDATLPDKQLYDKALTQEKSGHFDVARLDLQTLLNTYPDSQYLMRAKLAVADCWYKEGGAAALTQAEQEYNDFITFFPNAPEAAEAQMRIGDIYFKQMDVPDRDYQKATKAENAYRTMIRQYPDAPKNVREEATQKLREVQELLATREAEIAAFYATHENWVASIARYDTVIDSYPLYSHIDDAYIGKGDAYAAQAKVIRASATCVTGFKGPCLTEDAKARILQFDDGMAADAYRKVVLDHAAAPHVEDAKERLAAMNLPIPTPTPEQVAASEALEGSRAQYNMKRRLELLFLRRPDTVTAAQIGAPPLEDAPATTAPAVLKQIQSEYAAAINPGSVPKPAPSIAAPSAPAADTATPPPPPAAGAPSLSDVPGPGEGAASGDTTTLTATPASSGAAGNSVGVEVLSPNGGAAPAPGPVVARPAFAPPSDLPAASGAKDPDYGLKAAAPADATALPAVEKPAEAPDQINESTKNQNATADTKTTANGKKKPKAPKEDKTDESSSKDKKKKGLDKLNPF